MNIFSQVFNALPRQGPGSTGDTLRALAQVSEGLGRLETMLDVGCGGGAQSMVLLRNTAAHLTAVDLSTQLLAQLEASTAGEGFGDRLSTVECLMRRPPLKNCTRVPGTNSGSSMIWRHMRCAPSKVGRSDT